MLFQRSLRTFLLVVAMTGGPSTLAYQNPSPPKALDIAATLSTIADNEIDISAVLAETEAALQAAQETLPSCETINEEVEKFNNIVVQEEAKAAEIADVEQVVVKDQLKSTAIAGATIGVVTGHPLLLGAALGYAGSQMLEGENGEKAVKAVEEWKSDLTDSIQKTITLAQETYEEENGDLSKLSKKMMQNMLLEDAHDFDKLALLQQKKDDYLTSLSANFKEQIETTLAQVNVYENVKQKLESDEFKEDLKAAPSRAVNAISAFMKSDEVKAAQQACMKAVKNGLESDELKALKSRASQVIDESLKKKA